MYTPALLLTFILPFISATPTISPRAGPAAGTIITTCSQPNTIALTFDDGPWQYEANLVSTLSAAGINATFFVTGTLYNCIYTQATQLRATMAAGHQIGSHTWSHPGLGSKSAADIKTEMSKLETAFSNILGVKPTYMRPPNGDSGGQVVSVMREMGYRIVKWDIDSEDWNQKTPAQSEAKFTAAAAGSHVALMHETVQTTSSTLVPWVINWAKGKGLKFATIAECVGDAGGAYTTAAPKTGATTC